MISFELGKSLQQYFVAKSSSFGVLLFVHCPGKSWHYGDRIRTDHRVISAHFRIHNEALSVREFSYILEYNIGAES